MLVFQSSSPCCKAAIFQHRMWRLRNLLSAQHWRRLEMITRWRFSSSQQQFLLSSDASKQQACELIILPLNWWSCIASTLIICDVNWVCLPCSACCFLLVQFCTRFKALFQSRVSSIIGCISMWFWLDVFLSNCFKICSVLNANRVYVKWWMQTSCVDSRRAKADLDVCSQIIFIMYIKQNFIRLAHKVLSPAHNVRLCILVQTVQRLVLSATSNWDKLLAGARQLAMWVPIHSTVLVTTCWIYTWHLSCFV